MPENIKYRKKSVYALVAVIALCLLVELYLMHRNNVALQRSIEIQQAAEAVKVNTLDIIRNVHLLDLGLRGYALDQGDAMKSPMDTALQNKTKIFLRVENSLEALNYPLDEFNTVKETTNGYFDFIFFLKKLLDEGRRDEFLKHFVEDRGYRVWYDHRLFSRKVSEFADELSREAKAEYEDAQRNIYILQVAVLLIVVPTLLYTASFSNKTVGLAEQLKNLEAERSALLQEQNDRLERAVHDRTQEIQAQNEEIQSQSEEIVSHNEHLLMQQNEIEKQAHQLMQKNEELEKIKDAISSKNISLSSEIERQNQHLSSANKELLEQNNRLEQFAYIISHNLRAPIARLIGLTSIVDTNDHADVLNVFGMIKHSSQELDAIVKDLTSILSIQRLSPTLYTEIDLAELIGKLKIIFDREIHETNATINSNFRAKTIYSLSAYVESIFLNLISNSLKYRHPDRNLKINISSVAQDGFIKVSFEDNGIGIDLSKHGQNIFNLYKRFHFHVEGKGIGLFLVKTQVEALGGTVAVKSEIERGTTFEILFKDGSEKPKS
jgi:signal transduction histidine kinase